MSYEIEEIKQSQRIFYALLKDRQLEEEKNKELFRKYTESEAILNLVKSQAEEADCIVERYGNVIYLIPKEENEVLGFSKQELKNALCKSHGTDKDYYLSQFVILTLLVEFYDSNGRTSKSRSYLKGGELLNCVANRLKEGVESSKDNENQNGIAFDNILEAFSALRSDDRGSRARTTKEGLLYTVLSFLQKQGLIVYVEADDMIQTTAKLDHFMDWNLLNKNNYHRVLRILGEVEHE